MSKSELHKTVRYKKSLARQVVRIEHLLVKRQSSDLSSCKESTVECLDGFVNLCTKYIIPM